MCKRMGGGRNEGRRVKGTGRRIDPEVMRMRLAIE